MYTSAFTFAKRDYDDEFHALDNVIAQIARSIPGYLGEESWENAATGLIGGPTLTHISTPCQRPIDCSSQAPLVPHALGF